MSTNLFFFTATILEWKHLLKNDEYKEIITHSMKFLVKDERVKIYAFVIMPNHIHLVWRIHEPHLLQNVQRDFLKFTAQKMKAKLVTENPENLESYRVNAKDREFQFWERDPLSVELLSLNVIKQKIDYIHSNPIHPKWNLAQTIVDYKYSSARFYYEGIDDFGFLSNLGAEYV
ncbi:MAG: transposase [Ignavibacteria bacterium]|nr:transposase [Ignavibacteria bacterium]